MYSSARALRFAAGESSVETEEAVPGARPKSSTAAASAPKGTASGKPSWSRFLSRPEREQNAYFGFPKFFDLESLLDPSNFFVHDDAILVTASIEK